LSGAGSGHRKGGNKAASPAAVSETRPGKRQSAPKPPVQGPKAPDRWFRELGVASPHSLEALINIGKVGKAHGVNGSFQVVLLTDYPERFEDTQALHIHSGSEPVRLVEVESVQFRSGRIALALKGVDTPEKCDQIKHYLLCAGEDELVELEEGEYFHFQLEGLRALDESGDLLGTLTEVLATPAHEIYVVQTAAGEVLIPAVPEYVLQIDIEAGFVKLRLPVYADENSISADKAK
jgi:16S rRNA processing protein RimM